MEAFLKKYKTLILITGVVLIVGIVGGSFYGKVNNLRNVAIQKENALVTQYYDNQNELSTYILQFKESLGIADKSSERLEDILVEALKGRYEGDMEPGGSGSGSLFSAITEAYPDLTATADSYAEVQKQVIIGRNTYKVKQTKLLDMIRDYNEWIKLDLVDSAIIRDIIKAPTDSLVVTVDGDEVTGKAALKQIKKLVLVKDAVDSYETGITKPLIGDE